MDWDDIEEEWSRYRRRASEQWGGLTDEDLEDAGGRREDLIAAIQLRYGVDRDQAVAQVQGWFADLRSEGLTRY